MSAIFPIFLLLIFVLTFWILRESRIKKPIKLICIVLFFFYCVVFWRAEGTLKGWATDYTQMPKNLTIRHIVIKEPNFVSKGSIYFLLETPPTQFNDVLLKIFGFNPEKTQPRLFQVPYSRELHEKLQKDIIPRLNKGQIVTGRLEKLDKNGKNGKGKKNEKGGGSESNEQEFMFYELQPSYFQNKDMKYE